jgi:hypothetical protein
VYLGIQSLIKDSIREVMLEDDVPVKIPLKTETEPVPEEQKESNPGSPLSKPSNSNTFDSKRESYAAKPDAGEEITPPSGSGSANELSCSGGNTFAVVSGATCMVDRCGRIVRGYSSACDNL